MYGRFMVIAMRLSIAVLMAQNASADMRVVEQSFESSTAVRIPAGDDAPLDMRNCPGCPVVTLRINPETRYFIGDEQVTQADFRKAAARETVSMTVHYDPESRYVTRVIMWPS